MGLPRGSRSNGDRHANSGEPINVIERPADSPLEARGYLRLTDA
nr:MAG TPA: hypothetical protein [Caudoviricetes sp.]